MHAIRMRKAVGRHNQRLSTSWRDVIFNSLRGIASLMVIAHPAHIRLAGCMGQPPFARRRRKSAMATPRPIGRHPDQNYRTGFPRDSTSSIFSSDLVVETQYRLRRARASMTSSPTLGLTRPLGLRSHIPPTNTPPTCHSRHLTCKAIVALKYGGQPWPPQQGRCAGRAASLLLEIDKVGERSSVHGA